MKKFLLLIILASSSVLAKDITDEYNLPPYMKDCKVLMLPDEMFSKTLYTIYCPHSDVTTVWREGKHDNSTQTISGE